MGSLLTDPDFWSALSNFAWPVVAAVVLYRFHPLVAALLQRDNMQIKVGGLELSVQDAAKAHGKNIVEIQQRLAAIEANSTISQNFTSENEGRENINRKDRSILWVDDFPSNNAFLVDSLREKNVDVVLSLGTEDAMEKLKYRKFGAVITDLGRVENGVDNPNAGFDLIGRIKSSGDDVPILVFAGRRALEKRRALLEAGAENATNSGVDVLAFVERHLGAL